MGRPCCLPLRLQMAEASCSPRPCLQAACPERDGLPGPSGQPQTSGHMPAQPPPQQVSLARASRASQSLDSDESSGAPWESGPSLQQAAPHTLPREQPGLWPGRCQPRHPLHRHRGQRLSHWLPPHGHVPHARAQDARLPGTVLTAHVTGVGQSEDYPCALGDTGRQRPRDQSE